MKADVLKIVENFSKFGGSFYYIFLKDQATGKSYRTCIYPAYRNYQKWRKVIESRKQLIDGEIRIEVSGLREKSKGMLDADFASNVIISKVEKPDLSAGLISEEKIAEVNQ